MVEITISFLNLKKIAVLIEPARVAEAVFASGNDDAWGTTETRKSESMADGPTDFIHPAPVFSGEKNDLNRVFVLSHVGMNLRP